MTSRKIKYVFIGFVLVLASLALADSLGFFNPMPYTVVSMGAHNHYVPYNRDPDVEISKFPTRKPDSNEKITPTGQIVPKDSVINDTLK